MLVVLVIAGLAVIGCVVMVSLGRGGEMAEFPPDVQPIELPEAERLTAADLIELRLPIGLVGYQTQVVDETLQRVCTALSERDTRIAVLEQQLAELRADRPPLPTRRTDDRPAERGAQNGTATPAGSWEGDRADAEESW